MLLAHVQADKISAKQKKIQFFQKTQDIKNIFH